MEKGITLQAAPMVNIPVLPAGLCLGWGSTHPIKQLLWSEDFAIFIQPEKITEKKLEPPLGTCRPLQIPIVTAPLLVLSPQVITQL